MKKTKTVWRLKVEMSLKLGVECYCLYDEAGLLVLSDKSKHAAVEFAFEHGADEVVHDYDCVKHP